MYDKVTTNHLDEIFKPYELWYFLSRS